MNLEIFLKSYGFLSLAKKIGKNLTGKYGQELFDSAKKLAATKIAADALKTPSKRAIQTTPEATGDFTYNKIAHEKKKYVITKCSKNKFIKQIEYYFTNRKCNTKRNIHTT